MRQFSFLSSFAMLGKFVVRRERGKEIKPSCFRSARSLAYNQSHSGQLANDGAIARGKAGPPRSVTFGLRVIDYILRLVVLTV